MAFLSIQSFICGKALPQIFVEKGYIQWGNFNIILFLWLLGMLICIMNQSGKIVDFSAWAVTKIKRRKSGQLFIIFLGLLIFIDGAFNSLAIGSISRSLCDRVGISREKLAYLLDSTAAPVCVLVPISSWGASIIVILDTIIRQCQIQDHSGLTLFTALIPFNLYPWLTLTLLVFITYIGFDFKKMHSHELKAQIPISNITQAVSAKVNLLHAIRFVLPIVLLTCATFASLLLTGLHATAYRSFSLLTIMANAQVGVSLVIGSIFGVLTSYLNIQQKITWYLLYDIAKKGFKMMRIAIVILMLVWTLTSLIRDLHTGMYLANFIKNNHYVTTAYLPALLFIVAGSMAFATGTSWGTFAIMLPIAAEIAVHSHFSLLHPLLAASLSGSVFGDHCSPISDTTILSSAGAGCRHIDHVTTQLPYCMLAAGVTVVGYVILGFSKSILLSLTTSLFILLAICYAWFLWQKRS